jgi:hypothetical protein
MLYQIIASLFFVIAKIVYDFQCTVAQKIINRYYIDRKYAKTSERRYIVLTLEELKKDRELINSIAWDMTPELAVRMYLEWGNIWSRGEDKRHVVQSKKDYSVYFVVNCWVKPFYIYLMKMSNEEAVELAKFELPERFEKPVCNFKGVYAPDGELKEWLRRELNAA